MHIILVVMPKAHRVLGGPTIRGDDTTEMELKEQDGTEGTGLMWLRIRKSGRSLWTR